jgi:ABC-2 type transport system permease protein
MNTRSIIALMRKDIKAITSSPQMWIPMLVVPLLFVVVLPGVFLILGQAMHLEEDQKSIKLIQQLLSGIPSGALKDQIMSFQTLNQQLVYLLINYIFAPLFLMVPVMVSSIVSAAAFVGEKEKKTLETLLFSPMRETDMFLAKFLAAFVPAVVVSLAGFVLFCIEFMALGAPLFGRVVLPAPHWLAIILWLVPALSLLMIFLNVLVSAKVKGFQEAQQMSVIVILPILFLLYGQIGGVVFISTALVMVLGLVAFIADAVLIRFASRIFNRDKLFGTQVY